MTTLDGFQARTNSEQESKKMTPTLTVTNPPPTKLPPLPTPGDVRLDHLPITRRKRTRNRKRT